MTWTYSGNPADSTLDKIRFYIGDTDTNYQLLSDEEINFIIDEHTNTYKILSILCYTLATKYARAVDKEIGGASAALSQKSKMYIRLGDKYEKLSKTEFIPTSDFLSSDTHDAIFDIGMHDWDYDDTD